MFRSSALLLLGAGVSSAQTFFVISGQGTMSQAAAQAACLAQDATLASLHSDADYNDAKAKCSAVCASESSDCGCWLGIMDDGVEGDWYNMDNTYPDYMFDESGTALSTNLAWTPSEPNNAGDEDCAHIWRPQSYYVNDIACTDAGNYPLCRKTDENTDLKCAPGYDNVLSGDLEGECQIALECWGGNSNHLLGDNDGLDKDGLSAFNDISGCGMESCSARYAVPSVAKCNEKCEDTAGCVAYSWAPYSGDQNHPGVKVCTIYSTSVGNRMWETNQIFCTPCDKSAAQDVGANLLEVDAPQEAPQSPLFDMTNYNVFVEMLALNAAVSALVSCVVVSVCLTACYACTRSTKTISYEKVLRNEEDVAMNL